MTAQYEISGINNLCNDGTTIYTSKQGYSCPTGQGSVLGFDVDLNLTHESTNYGCIYDASGKGVVVDDDYVYYATSEQDHMIMKLDSSVSGLTLNDYVNGYYVNSHVGFNGICQDDTYVYITQRTGTSKYGFYKYDKATLTEQDAAYYNILYPRMLQYYNNHIYTYGIVGVVSLQKWDVSGLTLQASAVHPTSGYFLSGIAGQNIAWDDAPVAPSNLEATDISYITIDIEWETNFFSGDTIVEIYIGGTWTTAAILNVTATTYQFTGLQSYTIYPIRVALLNNGVYYYSGIIYPKTLGVPAPFCNDTWENRLTVTNTTCGNATGIIAVNNTDYFLFYDIILIDITGGTHAFNETTGEATGLSASYYFLTATPNSEYWDYLGGVVCEFDFIPVTASNTSMTFDNVSIRSASCAGFGASAGRIAYLCSDSDPSSTYSTSMYDINGDLVLTVTGTTIDVIVFSPLTAGKYYAVVTNDDNECVLLIGEYAVGSESQGSVGGIKRVFLTEWNNLIEYNYWSDSDEDYYLSTVDSNFSTSIKMKEFIDSTLPGNWYEIVLDTKGVTYTQTMNKTHQGFIFTDTIEITIPHADNAKWKQLVDILVNRYIIVFQDNNNYWWVMGYRHGAQAEGYRRASNEYILTFTAISENKIVTNMAEDYVLNNIIA